MSIFLAWKSVNFLIVYFQCIHKVKKKKKCLTAQHHRIFGCNNVYFAIPIGLFLLGLYSRAPWIFVYSANWASQLIWFAYNLKTVKPRKLNVWNNMVMNKSIMYADYGGHRSRNRGLRIQKLGKNCQFLLKIFWFAFNSKTVELVQLKFGHSLGQTETSYCTYNFRGQKLPKRDQI